ncbi:MAG: DsbA family protein [Gammaproteobacteria bacterium]|nr:DsbA family protein [Gammaproteobacteria bacterium]
MTQQFQEQGGAATMDPKPIARSLASAQISPLVRPEKLAKNRSKIEQQRISAGNAHVVEYFHQVDDGYSHLAAQMLQPLAARYDIELRCHLVSGPTGNNSVEPALLLKLAAEDSAHIAPHYGLAFPRHDAPLQPGLVQLATSILAAQDEKSFINCAADVGHALWADDQAALQALAEQYGSASQAQVQTCVELGSERRSKLKHYSGAMFYYAGEWYWGVDRLYHLENRLVELGAVRPAPASAHDGSNTKNLLAPRPVLETGNLKDDGRLTLEIYPSLRSPYTAISFDRAVKLASDTGVNLVVRPVLPMVMRGVPATREKGLYIFKDTAREARAAGVPFGNFYDPIGEPVRRCYSLYPWACEQGKGIELLSCFLRAAFTEGVNTNNDKGLQTVVENAGLDWQVAKTLVGKPGWEELLESNRLAMYDAGLWGVPSFRLLDENGEQVLALWGQDRLWLFASKIQDLLAARQTG